MTMNDNIELPSLSIIIPSYNCQEVLKQCLDSIALQDYPSDRLEVIAIDGGSEDDTIKVAESYNAKIIKSDHRDQEYNRIIGLFQSKGDIVIFLDSDNFLPHNRWLLNMILPMLEDPDIVATQPLLYHYQQTYSILNRYFALTGVNDPVGGYYLKKRDRFSYKDEEWNIYGKAEDKGEYYKVRFHPNQVPSLGANGYLARRSALLKLNIDPATAHHMDINYDLIQAGYDTFAMVKETIIHHSSISLGSFFVKKLVFARRHHLRESHPRKCPVYDGSLRDNMRILRFIIDTIIALPHIIYALKGYRKVKDRAWFLHPLICWIFLLVYTVASIEFGLRRLRGIIKTG